MGIDVGFKTMILKCIQQIRIESPEFHLRAKS